MSATEQSSSDSSSPMLQESPHDVGTIVTPTTNGIFATNTTAASSSSTTTTTKPSAKDTAIAPTDLDVLCGRGKGIRQHPGNILFNTLLKNNYDEYKAAPKGSKVSIVKKIVVSIRDGQDGGKGRFLERTRKTSESRSSNNDTNSGNDDKNWFYIDIGNERAMNKTAQAFRDIRVTMEKQHSAAAVVHNKKRRTPGEDEHDDNDASDSSPGASPGGGRRRIFQSDGEPLGETNKSPTRRPTFQERLEMLRKQREEALQGDKEHDSEHENDEASDDGSEHENENDEISDTETEDSFPMYAPSKKMRPTNKKHGTLTQQTHR